LVLETGLLTEEMLLAWFEPYPSKDLRLERLELLAGS
jgi:hypothetical protein